MFKKRERKNARKRGSEDEDEESDTVIVRKDKKILREQIEEESMEKVPKSVYFKGELNSKGIDVHTVAIEKEDVKNPIVSVIIRHGIFV